MTRAKKPLGLGPKALASIKRVHLASTRICEVLDDLSAKGLTDDERRQVLMGLAAFSMFGVAPHVAASEDPKP